MSRIEGGKIPAKQLMALLAMIQLSRTFCVFGYFLGIRQVLNDAWIGSLLGMVVAIPFVLLAVRLGLRFPDKTIIEYSEILLGKYLGKLIGSILIWYWIQAATALTRELGESFTIAIMPETPILAFIVVMVFLTANAARNGLEVVGRMSDNGIWVVLFFAVLIVTLPYDLMRSKNLLPVLAQGFRPVTAQAGVVTSFYTEFTILGMILPYLNRPKEAARFSVYAVLISGLMMTWLTIVLIAVFGPTLSSLPMPALTLSRIINIAQFIERVEVIALGAFSLAAALKLSLFFWAIAVGLAQLFGLRRYQPLIYPLGAVVSAFSVLFYESLLDLEIFFKFENWGIYSLTVTLGILIILYLASTVRSTQLSRIRR